MIKPIHKLRYLLLVLLPLPSIAAAELIITGVDRAIERSTRSYVSLASEPCDAEARLLRRRYRSVEAEARKALEPFGFYSPTISSTLTLNEKCWQATLTIDAGKPVELRNIDIAIAGAASSDPAFDDLARPVSLTSGAPLRHADYDRVKQALQVRAADRGYVEAAFSESRLDIWPEQGKADITLHFDSGPRYRLGQIQQEQNFLEPAIVSAYLDLETGAYFDSQDLLRAYHDLSDSAYFNQVEVVPDIEHATNGEIPIRVLLKPASRIEYTIGAGASTDTGLRLRAGFRNNRLNHRGHRLIADLSASPIVQGLTAEYRIPLGDPRREWFSVTAALSNEETDTFANEAQQLGIRWTKAMSETWLRTLALDAANESFAVGNDVKTTRSIIPSIVFDHKRSDRDIFPRRGRRLGVEIRGTDQALGSKASYLQTTTWMRWIQSFGSKNRVLARLNAGVTTSQDFSQLPPSVRFFAGGDESVRGFDYNSLGPKDADGTVIGGRNMLVASVEYERRLRGNFYGALFVDAGNAFDDFDIDPELGTGVGLKWRSPLGPIRLYLGYPLTDDNARIRIHLRLGADL